MKKIQKLGLVLALGMGSVGVANSSSSVTLYDNLLSPISAEQGIPPGWIADAFTTGSNVGGYNLGNITLKLSGGIDGSVQGIVLQLFSDIGTGLPGSSAIGHAFVDPLVVTTTPLDNVFAPNALDSSLVLSANTTYWVKLDATAKGAANVNWAYTSSGIGSWAFDAGSYQANGTDGPFLMKVEAIPLGAVISGPILAAPVPVPSAIWLMGSGLVGLISSWRRKKLITFARLLG